MPAPLSCSTAPGGQVAINVPFVNTGSVVVQQGKLSLNGGGADAQHRHVHRRRGDQSGPPQPGAGARLGCLLRRVCVESPAAPRPGVSGPRAGPTLGSSSFTGPVLDLGSSLEVYGTVSFAPAVGGPVTLTTGTLTIDPNSTLTGTDSFVANGLLTLERQLAAQRLRERGRLWRAGSERWGCHHPGHDAEQPRRGHLGPRPLGRCLA